MSKYREGKPCKTCGTIKKYESSGSCVYCVRNRTNAVRRQNIEHANKMCRQRYAEHRDERKLANKKWRQLNPHHRQQYYQEHKSVELKQNKNWRANNHAHVLFLMTKRKRRVRQATPHWVDHHKILAIYQNCPAGFQVDHIIPLQGKNVCGLHVPWNLQYLTPQDNMSKGNKHDVKI